MSLNSLVPFQSKAHRLSSSHTISDRRNLPINHPIIVSSALAEHFVRSVLKQVGIKKVKSNIGLEGFFQSPLFQEKDRFKLGSG